jgi:hypothetical protein
MTNQQTAEQEIIITEQFAVEIERTSRGCFATVCDNGSPYNGIYGFGSIPSHAIAALESKIRDLGRS